MKPFINCKLIAIITSSLILMTACQDPLDPSTDFMTYNNNQGLIGNGGGRITLNAPNSSENGTSIEIPEGALNSESEISISIDNTIRPLGDSLAQIIKIEPDGLTFSKPVTLKIPINKSIQNPRLFYFDPDSNIVEQIPIVEHNTAEGVISSQINHFSRYFVEDKTFAFFNVKLYKDAGNTIKANVKFGGANGLATIKISSFAQLTGVHVKNAREAIVSGRTNLYPANFLVAYLKAELLTGGRLTSKKLSSIGISIRKDGPAAEEFYVTVKQWTPDQKDYFISPILDSQALEDFFSGKALIIDFGIEPEYGSDIKYYIKLSWSLDIAYASSLPAKSITGTYRVNTYDDYPIIISDMINLNPDENKNFVDDSYDSKYKPNADFTASPTTIQAGQSVQFNDKSTNNPTSRLWDFGDGETSTNQNPLHTYHKSGYFNVSLTVSNKYGSHAKTISNFITVIVKPSVTTTPIPLPSITETSAIVGGNVTYDGYSTITERGVCWGTSPNPILNGRKLPIGPINDNKYSTTLSGLSPDQTYYVCAYATNSAGTGFGDEVSFKTLPSSGTIPTNGLVAYYPFNGNANDLSGNNNNGTPHGVTPTTDRHGNANRAYLFDGVDDYIEINHSASLNISQQISISFWVKFETSANYYYPYHIIEKYGCWGTGQRESDLNWGVETSTGAFNNWSLNYQFNRYYHIVQVYDGSKLYTYCDGVLKTSTSASGMIKQTTNKVYISRYNFGGDYFFDGTLDDFRIYNRALTQQEITALFNE